MPFSFVQRLFFRAAALLPVFALFLAAPGIHSLAGPFAGNAFAASARGDATSAKPLPTATASPKDAAPLTPEEERAMKTESPAAMPTGEEDTQPEVDVTQGNEASGTSEQAVYSGVTNAQILRGGGGRPSVSLYYPVFGDPRVDVLIREWIASSADSFERQVALEPGGDKDSAPEDYANWEFSGTFELSRPCEGVVSVVFYLYTYTGGAHGNRECVCFNLDLQNGRELQLGDLFDNPRSALDLLSDWSRTALKKQLAEDADETMIRAGTEPDAENFDCLVLQEGGVRILFPVYQVAPWSVGEQRVFMPVSALSAAGPSRRIWPAAQNAPQ
ncbi:MAG: DUF3298 and DUF4163 domain-containing protein [Desulfovibrio sp.]|nr:DUF3298 and DUF4163 domain-containing protein [Desulfovibrio sp.]